MNKTSLVLGIALAITGCSKKKEEGTVQKTTEGVTTTATTPAPAQTAPAKLEGKALADKYTGCVGKISDGKFDDFQKECLDPAFKTHDISDPNPHTGAELTGWFQSMRAGMPDMKLSPQLVIVSGRNILAVNMFTGTQTGVLKTPNGMDMPASNKKVGMLMFHRLAISDANMATEEWAYMDPTTMMGQLGALPKGTPPVRPAMEKGLDGAPIVVVTADDPKEKANIDLVRKNVDSFNARKMADWNGTMADNVTMSVQPMEKDTTSLKDLVAGMQAMAAGFPDGKVTIESTYAAGDFVVALGKFAGTNTGDMGPMKKTGKAVNLDYAEVFQIKDGKIAAIWRFYSGMAMAMQLGLMPMPGAAPAGAKAPAAGSAAAPAAGSAAAPAAGSAAAPAAGSAAAPAAGSAAAPPSKP